MADVPLALPRDPFKALWRPVEALGDLGALESGSEDFQLKANPFKPRENSNSLSEDEHGEED